LPGEVNFGFGGIYCEYGVLENINIGGLTSADGNTIMYNYGESYSSGIGISNCDSLIIQNNYIAKNNNGAGILTDKCKNTWITNNTISGNDIGMHIQGNNIHVYKNNIGVDSTSTIIDGNDSYGIMVVGGLTPDNMGGQSDTTWTENIFIGATGKGNIISGNKGAGIYFGFLNPPMNQSFTWRNIEISSNYIGTNQYGDSLPNGTNNNEGGIYTERGIYRNIVIGGENVQDGNVIMYNICDNHIGSAGISVSGDADGYFIQNNIISTNNGSGVFLGMDVRNVYIYGNRIGTDSSGNIMRGNSSYGIHIHGGFTPDDLGGSTDTTWTENIFIGVPDKGNIISGNKYAGIYFGWVGSNPGMEQQLTYKNIQISSNYIGTNTNYDSLPNGFNNGINGGIASEAGIYKNILIGGSSPEDGNTIMYNKGDGYMTAGISFFDSDGITIQNNIISKNIKCPGILLHEGISDVYIYNNKINFPVWQRIIVGICAYII